MKKIYIMMIILFSFFLLASCKKDEFKEEIKEYDNYTFYVNTPYGSGERQNLNVTIPNGKQGQVGLILMIHGGGWIAGDKEVYDSELVYWCESLGYVAAAINYSYAGEGNDIDEILNDITLSLIKIKEIAKEHNIDVDKMLLTGGSAGGHLSLLYAYSKNSISPVNPAAVVSYCGPTDLMDMNYYENNPIVEDILNMITKMCGYDFDLESYDKAVPFLKQASPIYYVTKETVPTVICHGMVDKVVPFSNAVTLDEVLTANNVEHEFVVYPNSGHGLEKDPESNQKARELMIEYANKYLN